MIRESGIPLFAQDMCNCFSGKIAKQCGTTYDLRLLYCIRNEIRREHFVLLVLCSMCETTS